MRRASPSCSCSCSCSVLLFGSAEKSRIEHEHEHERRERRMRSHSQGSCSPLALGDPVAGDAGSLSSAIWPSGPPPKPSAGVLMTSAEDISPSSTSGAAGKRRDAAFALRGRCGSVSPCRFPPAPRGGVVARHCLARRRMRRHYTSLGEGPRGPQAGCRQGCSTGSHRPEPVEGRKQRTEVRGQRSEGGR